jgi:toxin YoeB
MMNLGFTPEAWEDYLFWQSNNDQILNRINLLLRDVLRSPKTGMGKPEPLKWSLSGCWSRRIDREHRLVYCIKEDMIHILSCRYHYR